MALTHAEQYLLELTNRARLDPQAEANRFNIGLNDGVSGTIIGTAPKAALAHNTRLEIAADKHSAWMLDKDIFSHTGANGSGAGDRMKAAGYAFTGNWSWAENLAWSGSTGRIDLGQAIATHHEGLFRSAGHRVNTLSDSSKEVGIGQVAGSFTVQGNTYNASMTTLNFARTGTANFVTGVSYADANKDGAFSLGEGRGGAIFTAAGKKATTEAAGGYGIAVAPNAKTAVDVTAAGATTKVIVDTSAGNAKLDLIDNTRLATSVDLTLVSGRITQAMALGSGDIDITGNGAANILTGGRGNNVLNGAAGNDVLYGHAGNDHLLGGTGADKIYGGSGNDRAYGGSEADLIWGEAGNDLLYGDAGNDTIDGGAGADKIYGGADTDRLLGGIGNDSLYGGDGNDVVYGQNDHDQIWGEAGADKLYGGNGNDNLWGGVGNDSIWGDAGTDKIWGDDGHDVIYGGDANDALNGGAGNDRLYGGTGNDAINGGSGADRLWGDAGNDTLDGSTGNDILSGGAGADRFVFRANTGADTVLDFVRAQGDKIALDKAMFAANTSFATIVRSYVDASADGAVLDLGKHGSVLFDDVPSLQASDFVWL